MNQETTMEKPACKLFNGRYTVQSTKTGEHRTFWVRTHDADDPYDFRAGKRVVYLLTGSQNDDPNSYTGFAFADDQGIHVWRSKANRSQLWEQYADLLWTLALDGALSPWAEKGFTILMEGACCRCNRPLTNPPSIRTGIGPICESL